jgi:C4-dicarboxylate-specific signal transduction histidine kinase
MLTSPATEGLRVKTVRRGEKDPTPKPLGTREPLRRMAAHHALTAQLQHDKPGAVLPERRRKSETAQIGLAELVASIAHEVNQPIAAMAMSACACRRWLGAQPPNLKKANEALKHITRDAERASEVIARIRRLALGQPVDCEILDVGELIRDAASLLREKIRQHGATLRIGSQPAALRVRGDRVQLQQVLLNLMTNALESLDRTAETARQVRIESQLLRHKSVLVCIRDSGCGLDRQTAGRMFDAFFTTKPGSMGLGLAICRSIIERHGGQLWATQNQKPGTTFQFTLPLQR